MAPGLKSARSLCRPQRPAPGLVTSAGYVEQQAEDALAEGRSGVSGVGGVHALCRHDDGYVVARMSTQPKRWHATLHTAPRPPSLVTGAAPRTWPLPPADSWGAAG